MKKYLHTVVSVLLLATISYSSTHTDTSHHLSIISIEYGPETYSIDGNGCLVCTKCGVIIFNRKPTEIEYWQMYDELSDIPHVFQYSRRHWVTTPLGNTMEWEMTEEEI